jgi:hypothetical protein
MVYTPSYINGCGRPAIMSLRLARQLLGYCNDTTRRAFPQACDPYPLSFPLTHPRGLATFPGRWPLLFSSSPKGMRAASKTCRLYSPKFSPDTQTRDPHEWMQRTSPPKPVLSAAAPTTPSVAGGGSAQKMTSRRRRKRSTDARSAITNGRSGRDSCRGEPQPIAPKGQDGPSPHQTRRRTGRGG